MFRQTRQGTLWLLLALVVLLAVACGPATKDEATSAAETPGRASQEAAGGDAQADLEADLTGRASSSTANDGEAPSNDEQLAAAGDGEAATPDATLDEADDGSAAPGESADVSNEDGILTDDNRTARQRIVSEGWATDWNRHTVPYVELVPLLPVRDGIPAIDDPQFITAGEANEWLAGNEPVIAFKENGDARAYPLQIMTYHEIVNDVVGDLPVVVTFCPLCNSAIAFDRTLNGTVYDFGTSGWLRHSDLVMYDRQTESLWQQFTGEGIVGELAGQQLPFLPASIVSFADFRQAYPEGLVLSRETGHQRPYGQNPYPGYDTVGQNPFAFLGEPDGRLAAMERVIAVSLDEVNVAYPLSLIFEVGIVNDTLGGQDLVIFHMGGTASALDTPVISLGADVGATGVFDPNLNGQKLTFVKQDGIIQDEQTDSSWNILGQATDGPLVGETLRPILHGDYFWFAWAAFQPDTVIYDSE